MSTNEGKDRIEDHGTALDEEKNRVRCNYCGKEVRGFNRLKHHLGGLGNDVVPCQEAPADVKAHLREALLERKKERLLKEVGALHHPDLPLRRGFSATVNAHKSNQPTTSVEGEKVIDPAQEKRNNGTPILPLKRNFSPESSEVRYNPLKPSQPTTTEKAKKVMDSMCKEGTNGSAHDSCMTEDIKIVKKEEIKDEPSLHASRCIVRFFCEAGIDLAMIKLPSFQKMIDAAASCSAGYQVPRNDELRGWILEGEVSQAKSYVEEVTRSWEQTGCSILLDGWTNERGRNIIRFFVDCTRGPIFSKSVDATGVVQDVDALFLLFSGVIDEVGEQNVVQVVAYDSSCYMEAAGKKLMEKYKSLFWALSADYCINLILERIGMMDHVRNVLTKVMTITRFLYSHKLPLELMRKHIHGQDLVKTSYLKSVAAFLTMDSVVSQRENLMNMLNSEAWNVSMWAQKTKGKTVADIVKDSSFWVAAANVLKTTGPLVDVLNQIYGSDKTPMGCIYDAMDRAKEAIKRNLGDVETRYLPIWIAIDDIWDNYLHCPLHSAGYYLNPSLFYSSDFFLDAEVTNGLLRCIIRMVEDRNKQDLIVLELDAYKAGSGGFGDDVAVDQRTKVTPALWWSLYGSYSPELQRLAVRILCQTCTGASRYKLTRGLSEQLHREGRNRLEQEKLRDMEFVHYNLHLRNLPLIRKDQNHSLVLDDIDTFDDMIFEW